ncbi:hypothetical protein QWI17_07300 [Gilvimarinus sp. SDUM040013]|uniref:Collagen-binding domain-containing protein n=1 Tax=Gilvimarinus gilvus TaxID=3058038 RepID=A0ABU4RYM3_9GAMM|nr:hypothetical protein [Gilvimarinus sp. SDUM040013]MDO3385639.1 hypothetical protein [Gilvimarinus sp. SDUM040013]MDX6849973.1 hypothetical protein [Gilvimarinus sp. SDUM040013]
MIKKIISTYLVVVLGLVLSGSNSVLAEVNSKADSSIQPYHENQWYWQYKGEPIMLIGGSNEDNLWQWTGKQLTDHLDLLRSVGGNYVRCTMSDRKDGNVFAVEEVDDGKYDLTQWNGEYWSRLDFFLKQTEKRGIIVQLTLWDWFDLLYDRFPVHPLNPENNVNWEPETIGDAKDFYGKAVEEKNEPVLTYQHRYVDKLLSITLNYDHIIYNIQNESSLGAEWENYWAKFLKDSSMSQGKNIHVTSMQLLPGNSVRHAMSNRELYSYVEVSQNNQNAAGAIGYKHYENLIHWRSMIDAQQEGPMPMNNEKIYGAAAGENTSAGSANEAVERFWRNIFAGAASVRFHRPAGDWWGIGLSDRAQHTIKAASMFLKEFDIFNSTPYPGCETIGHHIKADYCLANVGEAYAVYFPDGRTTIALDPWVYIDEVNIKWLNLTSGEWKEETQTLDWTEIPWQGPDRVLTISPGAGAGGPEDGYGTGDPFIGIIEPTSAN